MQQGIHIKTKLTEKNKVHIVNMSVPEKLNISQTDFYVWVNVTNNGSFDANTWIQVNLVEKPSAIPQIEGIITIPAMTSERKELGKSNKINIDYAPGQNNHSFKVHCFLRETEYDKTEFNIQAAAFVTIDGNDYQVDTSTYYGIFHEQPICQGSWCMLLIFGIIFGVLIAISIIVVIIRILYPLYRIKKVKLKEERERIEKKE
jgi:hypothetical protein